MRRKSNILATYAMKLNAARILRQLSQAELAKKAGVSVSYVSMLERGQRNPPLTTVEKLARALRFAPHHFIWEVE